jgi:hypothetical protein
VTTTAATQAAVAVQQIQNWEDELAEAIRLMRDEEGASWADVAAVLGVTRQAAWRKYGQGLDDHYAAEAR